MIRLWVWTHLYVRVGACESKTNKLWIVCYFNGRDDHDEDISDILCRRFLFLYPLTANWLIHVVDNIAIQKVRNTKWICAFWQERALWNCARWPARQPACVYSSEPGTVNKKSSLGCLSVGLLQSLLILLLLLSLPVLPDCITNLFFSKRCC